VSGFGHDDQRGRYARAGGILHNALERGGSVLSGAGRAEDGMGEGDGEYDAEDAAAQASEFLDHGGGA
jgi:hypothetical protein